MNLQLLLEMYLQKRQQREQLDKEIDQIQETILDNPEFESSVIIDWNEIKRWKRTIKTLIKDAEIPEEYKTKVFDITQMISKEPSTWKRVQGTLMHDYPEYISEAVDTDKLKVDMPELFTEKTTNFLSLTKAK